MYKLISLSLRRLISPRVFLLGFVIGLLTCSLLGRKIAHDGYYENYIRIGGPYQVDNTFLVSPSQIRNVIRKECSKNKVLVLVGGSSIMMGSGQPVRYLWSRKLQELLGDGYCVFNLAGPAGVMNGYAATTLGILGNDYKNSYLITDMSETFASYNPDGVWSQKHYFWDAYYKNMLYPSVVGRLHKKEKEIQQEISIMSELDQARLEQIKAGEWLDSFLYFNDLWTYVHYNFFTTYYFHNAGYFQWKARKIAPDYDYEVNFDDLRSLKQYSQPVNSPEFNQTVERYGNLKKYFEYTPDGYKLYDVYINTFDKRVRDSFLTGTQQNVVVAYIGLSPYYSDHFVKQKQDAYETLYIRKAAVVEKYGYHVVRPRFGAEDFVDPLHLNTLGGYKLAQVVGDQIKSQESGGLTKINSPIDDSLTQSRP